MNTTPVSRLDLHGHRLHQSSSAGPKLMISKKLRFNQVLEQLRDGKPYVFFTAGMAGYFFKAPHPVQEPERDGALSAITYWKDGLKASPVLMLYDFDEQWTIHEWANPESFKR